MNERKQRLDGFVERRSGEKTFETNVWEFSLGNFAEIENGFAENARSRDAAERFTPRSGNESGDEKRRDL